MPRSAIRIIYADSDSGIIVAVKAVKELVPEVRKLLMEILVFTRGRKAEQLSKRVKAAGEALDFCAKVKARETANQITADEASRAVHTAITAATELLEYGTILREMRRTIREAC